MLLLAIGFMTGQAASYDVWVCGVQVTDNNKDNIGAAISSSQGTVTGKVSYDPTAKLLTVNGSSITTSKDHGIRIKVNGVTIQFVGTCSITTTASDKRAIRYDASNLTGTIQGNGLSTKVTMKGTKSGIYIDDNCDLTIQNMTLSVTGTNWGICGHGDLTGSNIYINGASDITAEATASNGEAMGDLANLLPAADLYFILPQGGWFCAGYINEQPKFCVLDVNDKPAQKVRVAKLEKTGLTIHGWAVTNCNWQVIGQKLKNRDRLTSDASSLQYDWDSKTLTLNGVQFDTEKDVTSKDEFIQNSMDGLKIIVKGTNVVKTRMGFLTSYKNITIEGSTSNYAANSLTVNRAMEFNCDDVTLKNLVLNATSPKYAIGGGANTALTINKCKVTANYTGSSNIGAIQGFKSVQLTMADVKSPYVFYRPSKGFVVQNGTDYTLTKTVEIAVPSEYYNVRVLGHQISSVNTSQFGVDGLSGSVSYNPTSKCLTLNGCSLKSTDENVQGIYMYESDARIELNGTNTIETAGTALLLGAKGTRIITSSEQPNNSVTTFKSTQKAAVTGTASVDWDLIVKADQSVKFDGKTYAFSGKGIGASNIEFQKKGDKSRVYMKGGSGVTANNPQITMINMDFWSDYLPGCYWDELNGQVYRNGGVLVTQQVALAAVKEKYGVYVAGNEINDVNCSGVGSKYIKGVGNYVVTYNPSTKTLNLNDATIDTGSAYSDAVENRSMDGLTINVTGSNTLKGEKTSCNALNLQKNTTVTGDGTLNLTGSVGNLKATKGATVRLKDINMTAQHIQGHVSSTDPDKTAVLVVDLAKPGKTVTAESGIFALYNVVLENDTQMYEPLGGYYNVTSKIMMDASGHQADRVVFMNLSDWTAIEDVEGDTDFQDIYDLTGRKQNTLRHGLNIVQKKDGTARKVISSSY